MNGFLTRTDEDWVDKLTLLIDNADLRRWLGREARLTIAQGYTLDVQLPGC